MRVFLCDFHLAVYKKFALELKAQGADILYWTGYKAQFSRTLKDPQAFPDTVFHDVYDAAQGIPAPGFSIDDFEPPGKELLDQLLECKSTTLFMMTKADFRHMPYVRKNHLFLTYVHYWNGILQKYKPDALIFYRTPHYIYNYVLFSLAQLYNIKTIIVAGTNFRKRNLIMRDYRAPAERIDRALARITPGDAGALEPYFQNYVNALLTQKEDVGFTHYNKARTLKMQEPIRIIPPFAKFNKAFQNKRLVKTSFGYMKELFRFKRKIFTIDKDDHTNYSHFWQLKKIEREKKALRREYHAVMSPCDPTVPYVYFPLHYQPEASTSPLGGHYADQILAIKTLAAGLPNGWVIYVKENPMQLGSLNYKQHLVRFPGYYREIAALKNVKLIDPQFPTHELSLHAQAVGTITGTAGLEALVLSKPVLYFGNPWYMHASGTLPVHDASSVRAACARVQSGFKPVHADVIAYLHAFQDASNANPELVENPEAAAVALATNVWDELRG